MKTLESAITALSPREHAVLELVWAGFTDKAIAAELGLSLHTIKGYCKGILRKLNAPNRARAAVMLEQYHAKHGT